MGEKFNSVPGILSYTLIKYCWHCKKKKNSAMFTVDYSVVRLSAIVV